jgi:low temperature requirement protein LtrA
VIWLAGKRFQSSEPLARAQRSFVAGVIAAFAERYPKVDVDVELSMRKVNLVEDLWPGCLEPSALAPNVLYKGAMVGSDAEPSLFRVRRAQKQHRVSFIEIFFDLVFVFALTQLSHTLVEDFSPWGLVQGGLCLVAVWWAWICTSWITHWLDPDRAQVRFMLFGLMLAGLALSTSIPQAFGARGLIFAAAYVTMQLGRTVFILTAIPKQNLALTQSFRRVLAWLLCAAAFWLLGGLREPEQRLLFWSAALLIEYVGPAVRFWAPGLGATNLNDGSLEGAHLAERCALFIIIALGESILMTSATFTEAIWTVTTTSAFVVAFTGSLAMWWIYFDKGALVGMERIAHDTRPGRLARLAHTYLHLPLVAGISLFTVGNEFVLAHPNAQSDARITISVVGGPLLYVSAALFFKRAVRGWFQLSHLMAIGLLAVLALVAARFSALTLAAMAAAVLALAAIWESLSLGSSDKLEPRN